MEDVGYFLAIWSILPQFGIFLAIWFIFSRFGMLCQEKSGNLFVLDRNIQAKTHFKMEARLHKCKYVCKISIYVASGVAKPYQINTYKEVA
jgi:hypothetical protein